MTRIGNISFRILTSLRENAKILQGSLQRLSSGKRLLRPADDIASYSSITKLESKVGSLGQRILAVNEAKGMTQSLDSALSTQIEILQRIKELGLAAMDSSLSSSERDNLSKEILSLSQAFQAITDKTEFNGRNLLRENSELSLDSSSRINLSLSATNFSNVFTTNKATGTFNQVSSSSLPSVVNLSVSKLADLDNDGILDRISGGKNYVSVELGQGDGHFGADQLYSTSEALNGTLRVADINNDGNLDFLVSGATTLRYYLGNGDGGFQSQVVVTGAAGDYDIGDVNEDGNIDILSVASSGGTLSVQLGDGDGGFSVSSTFAVGPSGQSIRIGDLNGDGHLDFGAFAATEFRTYLGSGDGSFSFGSSFSSAGDSIDFQDLDADGDLDLVYVLSVSNVHTRLNNGDGSFGSIIATLSGTSISDYELGDVDRDGNLDLVYNSAAGSPGLHYARGLGNGNFSAASNIVSLAGARTIDLADFNQDGVLDILMADTTLSLYRIYRAGTNEVAATSLLTSLNADVASQIVDSADGALSKLVAARSKVGAVSNQLDFRLSALGSENEVQKDSLNLLEEVDLPSQTALLLRSQIQQQAQLTALLQANVSRQRVLSLLTR